jgi:putative transposase
MSSPAKHHRRSLRLKGYDYSQSGAYFVAVCTKNREPLLGTIVDGEMRPSPVGEVSERLWREIPHHFSDMQLDEFVIMPNHVHGIIILWGDNESQNLDFPQGLFFGHLTEEEHPLCDHSDIQGSSY